MRGKDNHRRAGAVGRFDGMGGRAIGSNSRRGFTLIEVIVAFAVLALALAIVLGTLSNASRQVRWSDDAGRAALHAQSLLDDTGVAETLVPGRSEGVFDDGRYRWTLDVAPWREPVAPGEAPQPVDPAAPQLLRLALDVYWGEGRDVRAADVSRGTGDGDPAADDARTHLHLESLRYARPPDPVAVAAP